MSLLKRAWLSVSRRVGKSVVLLLIMTVIFTALVAEASVRGSMQALRENVSRGVPAGFVVRPGSGDLSPADAQSVAGVQGVTAHNYVRDLTATPSGLKLVEMPTSGVELSGDVAPEAGVSGVTRSDLIQGFAAKQYTLVEGRHVADGDQNSAIVHQELAAKNGLRVGGPGHAEPRREIRDRDHRRPVHRNQPEGVAAGGNGGEHLLHRPRIQRGTRRRAGTHRGPTTWSRAPTN